jgi:hypothetical protein
MQALRTPKQLRQSRNRLGDPPRLIAREEVVRVLVFASVQIITMRDPANEEAVGVLHAKSVLVSSITQGAGTRGGDR